MQIETKKENQFFKIEKITFLKNVINVKINKATNNIVALNFITDNKNIDEVFNILDLIYS